MKIFNLLIAFVICFGFYGCIQKEEPKPLQQTVTTPSPQPVKKVAKKKRTKKAVKPVAQTTDEPAQVSNPSPATQTYTIEQTQPSQEQTTTQHERKSYIYTITQ